MKKLISTLTSVAAIALGGIAWAGPVNINTADAETLAAELTGVGPALARAIVEDRDRNGQFVSAEDLTRVSGVGMRIVENNREYILVESSN